MSASPVVDLLRWPVIGPFLRWKHARGSMQVVLLLVALALILHGLLGPQIAPANLATVLSWVHYRGLLLVALLAVGNIFCTACPFVFVRDAGRRLRAPIRRWPRWLRTKWIGIALIVAVLFSYELFDLWAQPRATALLIAGYFIAALLVDLLFTGATFCKFLCPIGQFSFVASTVSPLEVQVRDKAICRTCATVDCIRGRRAADAPRQVVQRGCELSLFLPSKVGNLDCTLCLDCVHACPHDNVAIAARVPALELVDTRRRSGIGALAQRRDIAALVVVFVFGGLVNAFGMVTPAVTVERWLAGAIGVTHEAPVLAVLFAVMLVAVPVALLGTAGALTTVVTGAPLSTAGRVSMRYVYGLIPLGCAIWLSHYGFHLLTGALTVVPVTQRAAIDLFGWPMLGDPLWRWTGMQPGSVFPLEVGVIVLGSIGSLGVTHLIAERDDTDHAVRATGVWAVAILGLALAALWILSQPMDMRGLGVAG